MSASFVSFGNLLNYKGNMNPSSSKQRNRLIPVPLDKRGGRIRASMMTDHYEQHFIELMCKAEYIPVDYFHNSKYGDNIMKNVISIHFCQEQVKYERIGFLEFWSQIETRKQLESYYREVKLNQTNRSREPDIKQMVFWWYDKKFGIQARIEKYNASNFSMYQPFFYDPESTRIEIDLDKNWKKRKREIEQEIEPEIEPEIVTPIVEPTHSKYFVDEEFFEALPDFSDSEIEELLGI